MGDEFKPRRFRVKMRLTNEDGDKHESSRERFEGDIQDDPEIAQVAGIACAEAFLGFHESITLSDRATFAIGVLDHFSDPLYGPCKIKMGLADALQKASSTLLNWVVADEKRIEELCRAGRKVVNGTNKEGNQ